MCEYFGEIVSRQEYLKREKAYIEEDMEATFYTFRQGERKFYFDGNRLADGTSLRPRQNPGAILNHRIHPNCEVRKLKFGNSFRLVTFSLCRIERGTELLTNYAAGVHENQPDFMKQCNKHHEM